MTAAAPLIWMNGWSGVGKRTAAECLSLILGDAKALLVDAHEFAEQEQLLPEDPGYETARARERATAFARYVDPDPSQKSAAAVLARAVIFTECQGDNATGRAISSEYEAAAARAGRPLVPVYLYCQKQENMRRVQTVERSCSLRSKVRGPGHARSVRASAGGRLFRFPGGDPDSGGYPSLTLDVTRLDAHEAAMQILAFVNELVARRAIEAFSANTTPLESQPPEWKQLR